MTQAEQMRKVLESVARECSYKASYHEITPMCPSIYNKVVERNVGNFMVVLERTLLPLLEAGQAMRDDGGSYECGYGPTTWAWDEAVEKAMK